eukprot:3653105-Pleurochrysis_carterae.AAC.1
MLSPPPFSRAHPPLCLSLRRPDGRLRLVVVSIEVVVLQIGEAIVPLDASSCEPVISPPPIGSRGTFCHVFFILVSTWRLALLLTAWRLVVPRPPELGARPTFCKIRSSRWPLLGRSAQARRRHIVQVHQAVHRCIGFAIASSLALSGEAEIAARLSRPEGNAPLLYERLPHLQLVVRIVSIMHKDVELAQYVDEARQRLLTKLEWIRKNNAVAGGSVPATLPLLPPTAAPFQTLQSQPAHLDVARPAHFPPSEARPASASMDVAKTGPWTRQGSLHPHRARLG